MTTPRTDAVALDRNDSHRHPDCSDRIVGWTDYEALLNRSREIERNLADAQEALAAYKTRNAESAVHRLHNLCDVLDAEAKDSPYSAEAWQLQEEAYRVKCAELKEAQEALKAAEARADRLQSVVDAMREAQDDAIVFAPAIAEGKS